MTITDTIFDLIAYCEENENKELTSMVNEVIEYVNNLENYNETLKDDISKLKNFHDIVAEAIIINKKTIP